MSTNNSGIDKFDRMVAESIRRKRTRKGLSEEQLAEKAAVDLNIVRRMESGTLSFDEKAMKLIKALDMNLDDFYIEKSKTG